MFVIVFVVKTIKIFCDGFIFYFFSVGHKPVSVIVAAVCHMTSMRAPPPLLVPPRVHDAPDTTIQNYLLNK